MPSYFRGAGTDTYWHHRDARLFGFDAWAAARDASISGIIHHIVRGTVVSPYVSLTRSYGVAFAYAVMAGHRRPSQEAPGFVYEVEIEDSAEDIELVDPVIEISSTLPDPIQPFTYHHDGGQDYLLGVMAPHKHKQVLRRPYLQPPPGEGTPRPPKLTIELEALVRALRDAEVLAVRKIPHYYVKERYEVW